MDPQPILALIGVVIGGSALKTAEYAFTKREIKKKEAKSWTKARGTTSIALFPEHTKEDRAWVSSMLEAGGLKIPVKTLCSCGYGEECAMHCNHGVHPDCKGDSYFKLNDIETAVKPKPPVGPGAGSKWGGRFIEVNHTTDTVTISEAEVRRLRNEMQMKRAYLEAKQHQDKYKKKVAEEKARREKEQKVEAFKAKMIARHQTTLKARYGNKQLELPFGKETRTLPDIIKSIERLERELKTLQRLPMPIQETKYEMADVTVDELVAPILQVRAQKVWNAKADRWETRLVDVPRARRYTKTSVPR